LSRGIRNRLNTGFPPKGCGNDELEESVNTQTLFIKCRISSEYMSKGERMNNKQILLVEDNPDDVKLTLRALEKSHIANEVVVAQDGVEAIEYLSGAGRFSGRNSDLLPQVVLLDLKMPRMDGLEFLQRIRAEERTRLLPVVVLTTSNEDRDRVESYKLGANSYVRKPVDFNQFAEAVQNLGLYWLVLNESP
jgi:two-component system response regulator